MVGTLEKLRHYHTGSDTMKSFHFDFFDERLFQPHLLFLTIYINFEFGQNGNFLSEWG